jgi:hypothetical protein
MEERLFSEANLMEMLGLKKSDLALMRKKGLTFVKVSKVKRLYLLSDIHAWAGKNKMSSDPDQTGGQIDRSG